MTLTPSPEDLWESNFGSAPAFALGLEEELLLVGAANELADGSTHVLRAADPDEGDVTGELFRAMVESKSEISANAREAAGALAEVRSEILGSGARIMGVGVHPNAAPGEAGVQQTPRYALIEDALQGVLRTPICGMHIHVGMPDKETAVRVYNGIRTHVPLLNALAANSPFWFGEDSGLASARTVIFRSYPRAAMAPAFEDFPHFCRVTRQVCAAAGIDDYTQIWWDARIHPGLGTVEVRAADAQFDLARVAALTALVHCLCRVEAERDQRDIPAREALAESSFQATRHGLAANLLDRRGEVVAASDLGRRSVEVAAEAAGELGCEEELRRVVSIIEEGNGADLQRAVHGREGMEGLLRFLVAETAALGRS
ncbi:MAG TPA: YbdK family carboxylate-amine ligase [Solirubrobacterales bacterium]|nr:YbdK family carboxylate-amine ligase [Solirubrobacterales bacterium]